MRYQTNVLAMVLATRLMGCNQPAVAPKEPAFQSSESTIRDWNDVAHQIASTMAWMGLLTDSAHPASAGAGPPVFVRVRAQGSAFAVEVAGELESDIVQGGGVVARSPTVVNLDVNFVRWGPRDKPPGLVGTELAVLAIPGIVLGASAPMSTWAAADAAALTALGLGAFADAAIALTPTMNAEAVWEATIVTDDRVVMKLQEPVYIRAPDIPLYRKVASLGPMSSWSQPAPLRARMIHYDP
jgi:hypothetical protein